jgi:hypothetical protein
MLPRRIYLEGRCRLCGMRVTVDRERDGHTRDGRWCGPVETDQPSEVPDQPILDWVVRSPPATRPPVTS